MINIGNYMFVAREQIQAVLDIKQARVQEMVAEAQAKRHVYDCTKGNIATAIVTLNNNIYLSSMNTRTINARIMREMGKNPDDAALD